MLEMHPNYNDASEEEALRYQSFSHALNTVAAQHSPSGVRLSVVVAVTGGSLYRKFKNSCRPFPQCH